MTYRLIPLVLLMAAVPGVAQSPAPPPGGTWTQMSIHERVVIRIPRMRRGPDGLVTGLGEPVTRWKEKKGPRCVPAEDIIGATIPHEGSVDLILADGQRTRALLDGECPALSYYPGFYLRPAGDGLICAGRDPIRSRSGAICPIRTLRRLVPAR